MQLLAFRVAGFRSLADAGEIPVRRPTVLTGANDGGKTASLDALGYLLGDYRPTPQDPTALEVAEDGAALRTVDRTVVTGTFQMAEQQQEQFGLPERVRVRRVREADDPDRYELHAVVPVDERLRGLDSATLAELRDRAGQLMVEPQGDARRRDSWLGPLAAAAEAAPTTEQWVPAPHDLVAALPRYLRFSSTREPDLRSEIQQALRGTYDQLPDDEAIVGQVRDAERQLQTRLEHEAAGLRDHILDRCPELHGLRIEPLVSFREGFGEVTVHSGTRPGLDVPLEYSGAGRRRRMTLAVWEWTRNLLDDGDSRPLIIAYDEPDTHLDYGHQRELVDLIRAQATRDNVRTLLATHSLNLIDKVEIGDVVHIELTDGTTRVSRMLTDDHDEIDRHLATISTAMGLRNSVLIHERLFVGVEGPTEAQALPILFRLATGYSLQAAGIALVSGNSNRGALDVARWLSDHNRPIRFIIDRDSTHDPHTRKIFTPQQLEAVGISPDQMHLLGAPNELEDLFDDHQWAAVANQAWPRVDGHPWTSDHFAALRNDGKFSTPLLEMARIGSDTGPASKTECLITLASHLDTADAVPDQLRNVFDELIAVPAHPPGAADL